MGLSRHFRTNRVLRYHGAYGDSNSVAILKDDLVSMSAVPNFESSIPPEDKFKQAANVAAVVSDSGISQKISPMATASIAIAIQNIVRSGGTDTLMNDDVVASIAAVAASAEPVPVGHPEQIAVPVSAEAAGSFDSNIFYEELAKTEGWVPLQEMFSKCGAGDRSTFDAAVEQMLKDGFLAVENDHLYVTESGKRFLEYSRYSRK